MYQYRPIYQGDAIEEEEKVYARAAAVYDDKLKQSDLIDTVLSQMKVPKGGEGYVTAVKDKVKSILDTVATDVAGGKRWDLASPQIHNVAKIVANDKNLTFLQEQQKKYERNELNAEKSRIEGKPPIYFGDDYETYKPFDKDGKTVEYKGWYEPKGDWDEKLTSMLSVIKPNEWDELSKSEQFPGYMNDKTFSSNVKKIDDNIKGVVQRFVTATSAGDQMLRKFMKEGYSREDAIAQITKYARSAGNALKVEKTDNNLSVDQIALAQSRASTKATPNAINDVFDTDSSEIVEDGPKVGTGISDDAFDKDGNFKDTYTTRSEGIAEGPSESKFGTADTKIARNETHSTSEIRKKVDELRRNYPDFKINGRRPTDAEWAKEYERGLASYNASVRTTARIKDEDVKNAMTNLSNFRGYLDRSEGYVMGGNAKDAKTLRDQIKEKNSKFDFGSAKFEATDVNLAGPAGERATQAGGVIGNMYDKDGNVVRVVLPLPSQQSRHFSTVSNVIKATKEVTAFGRGKGDTSRGVGKRVEDTSGLVRNYMNHQLDKAGKSVDGIEFAFRPHRFSDESKSDGSYGSSSGINQNVRYGLEYNDNGVWKAVIPGTEMYKWLEKNGADPSDWTMEDLRTQSLSSFRNDGMINNALNNRKNTPGPKTEE